MNIPKHICAVNPVACCQAQTLIEYALIISILAVVLIAVVAGFGTGVQENITNSDTELQRAFSGN